MSSPVRCDGCARRSPQRPGAAVKRTAGPPRVRLSVYPRDGQPLVRPLRVVFPPGHATDEEMLVACETRR